MHTFIILIIITFKFVLGMETKIIENHFVCVCVSVYQQFSQYIQCQNTPLITCTYSPNRLSPLYCTGPARQTHSNCLGHFPLLSAETLSSSPIPCISLLEHQKQQQLQCWMMFRPLQYPLSQLSLERIQSLHQCF